jgi:hypothetical protein
MNTTVFNNLLKNSVVLDNDNLNPVKSDKIEKIEQTTSKPQLYNV